MESNVLYRAIPEVFLNGRELGDNRYRVYPLRYGQPYKKKRMWITNFDAAWKSDLKYCKKVSPLILPRYIRGDMGLDHIRVTKSSFESYEEVDRLVCYTNKDFTLAELGRLLPAADFLRWLDDNKAKLNSIAEEFIK